MRCIAGAIMNLREAITSWRQKVKTITTIDCVAPVADALGLLTAPRIGLLFAKVNASRDDCRRFSRLPGRLMSIAITLSSMKRIYHRHQA